MNRYVDCTREIIKHVALGKFIQVLFKPSATSIFMRAVWIVLFLVLLPTFALFSGKHGLNVTTKFYNHINIEQYTQLCLLFFGSLWAVYSGLRVEFVSKYTALLADLDNNISLNSLKFGTIDGKEVIRVNSKALFFLEDCISLGFDEHITFKQTCRWIGSALIQNQNTYPKYYEQELENLPVFKKKVDKMSKNDRKIEVEFWSKCQSFDGMNDRFIENSKQ